MGGKRFVLNDQVWERLAPLLPGKATDSGRTGGDNRLFLEAVFWRVRTGSPWRDLPPDLALEQPVSPVPTMGRAGCFRESFQSHEQ